MSKRDYYEVLGVPRDADDSTIKGAYRRLARQYHPDVNKASDAEERFKEINEAYEILSDADHRAAYDRYGHAGTQGFPGGAGGYGGAGFPGFNDIFEEFFGGFSGMRGSAAQRGPARGADLRYDLEITFQEAVFGVEKEIEIVRQELCPTCNGSGAEPGTKPIRCPQCNGAGEVRRATADHPGAVRQRDDVPALQWRARDRHDAMHCVPRAEACARHSQADGQHPGGSR